MLVGAPEYNKVCLSKQTSSGGYHKTTELTASDSSVGTYFGFRIGGRGADVLAVDRGDDSTVLFSYEGGCEKKRKNLMDTTLHHYQVILLWHILSLSSN